MAFTPATGLAGSPRYTPLSGIPAPTAASAAPNPAYSGTFIPEIWSSKLVEKFYDATVLAAIANTDYEGEISAYGDKVNIRTSPDITIRDYAPDMLLQVERPSAPLVNLSIDQAHYFNTVLDDVYRTQSDIDLMNLWAVEASEKMKIKVDTNVLAGIPALLAASGAAGANMGLTGGRISGDIDLGVTTDPVHISKDGAVAGAVALIEHIVDLGSVLDEQNVPETDRFIVMPTRLAGVLKKSELRDASLTGDGTSVLRNGRIGVIDRFTLYASNLLPNPGESDEAYIMAGHPSGLTFAAQMTNMETLRSEATFGELMRGLMIYGFGLIKPESLAMSVVTRAAP